MYCLLVHFSVENSFALVDISLAGLQNLALMNSEKSGFPPWHIPVVHDSFVNSAFSYDKKGLLGSVLLRPPHESMNLHRSCIQFDITLQLAETDLLRTLSKRSD